MCKDRCGVCLTCKNFIRFYYLEDSGYEQDNKRKRRVKDRIKAARKRKYEMLGA